MKKFTAIIALLAASSLFFNILLINTAFSVSLSLTISGEVEEEETPVVETVNAGGGIIMVSHTSKSKSATTPAEQTPEASESNESQSPTEQILDVIIDAVTTESATEPTATESATTESTTSQLGAQSSASQNTGSQTSQAQESSAQEPSESQSSIPSPSITNLPQDSDFQFVQQVIPERTKEEIKLPDVSEISLENQSTAPEIIETSENEKLSIEGQIEGQEGENNSQKGRVLLEIINTKTGEPKIIEIESGEEGNWKYDPAYKLQEGDYKAFVWFFSQGGNEKSNLVNSFSFSVKEKASAKESMKASTVSIVTENGMAKFKIKLKENSFSEAWTDSIFYKILQGESPEKKLFYINGQILNEDDTLNASDTDNDLRLVFIVTPILKAQINNEELFGDIEYKIYNSKGELVQSITDKNEYLFSNNIMAFYKELPLSANLATSGNYHLVVSMKTKEIEYETQFDFIVVAQESDNIKENPAFPIRDMVFPGAIIFSILAVVFYFYKKN